MRRQVILLSTTRSLNTVGLNAWIALANTQQATNGKRQIKQEKYPGKEGTSLECRLPKRNLID